MHSFAGRGSPPRPAGGEFDIATTDKWLNDENAESSLVAVSTRWISNVKHYSFDALAIDLGGTPRASELLAPILSGRSSELLVAAYVGQGCGLLGLTTYPGGSNFVSVPTDAIVREALEVRAVGIVLGHNHPSGTASPSESDILLTRRMCFVLEAIGVTLLDHIIFNSEPYFSFRQRGFL
jgi:DNA repair protein RadC